MDEDEDEGEAGAGEEKTEHYLGGEADEVEDIAYLLGQLYCKKGQRKSSTYYKTTRVNLLEAPASNSFLMIATGLNQYSVCVGAQFVMP